MNYNQAHSTFPVDETSLAYMYSVSIFLTNVQTTYIAELLQSRHFQLGTAIPRSLGGIIRNSVSLLLIRITFYSGNLFSRIVTLGNGVERGSSLTHFLSYITSTYARHASSFYDLTNHHSVIPLTWLALGHCIGWTRVLNLQRERDIEK